jgi:hypothetical protein
MRPTVVCLGEALALVPALPTASTVPGPGTAHRAGADPLGEFRRAELRAPGVEVGGRAGDRP